MASLRTIVLLTFIALLATPTVALACSLAMDPRSPKIPRSDLRIAKDHESVRTAWVKHHSWQSARTSINQHIKLRGMDDPVAAAFAQQRSIKLMVQRPGQGEYADDSDPTTTCARIGERVWSTPRVLVRQTSKAIFVTAVSRKAAGSTDGCTVMSSSCDDLTFRTIGLDAPIGERRIYTVTFA